MLRDLRRVMFPRYFGDETPTGTNPEYFIGETLIRVEDALRKQLREALLFSRSEKLRQKKKLKSESMKFALISSNVFQNFSARY